MFQDIDKKSKLLADLATFFKGFRGYLRDFSIVSKLVLVLSIQLIAKKY